MLCVSVAARLIQLQRQQLRGDQQARQVRCFSHAGPPVSPSPGTCRVAEACAATLAEMNPFVQLATLPGPVAGALAPDRLSQFDLVLLTGQPAWVVDRADALCRAAGVPFYAAACRGISGWAFADLGQHEYVVEVSALAHPLSCCGCEDCCSCGQYFLAGLRGCGFLLGHTGSSVRLIPPASSHHQLLACPAQSKKEQPDGSVAKSAAQHSASYPAWEATMGCSLKDRSFRRANMLYLVLRGGRCFCRIGAGGRV